MLLFFLYDHVSYLNFFLKIVNLLTIALKEIREETLLLITVGNSIERILYEKCHKNKICSSFAALAGFTDSNLYEPEKLINNVRHDVSCFSVWDIFPHA